MEPSESAETRLGNAEELDQRQRLLSDAMEGLNAREREIIVARRLTDNPATLDDLSQKLGVSRERVRQIEVRAFEKLQRAIKQGALERRLAPTA